MEEFKGRKLIYDVVSGSHAYGTNIETSDIDKRGIFWVPIEEFLKLNDIIEQISDEKNDTTYYSLKRVFELLTKANPNIIELLWMPDDCIVYADDIIMPELIENRDLFVTKRVYQSHYGYAMAQIKKARGKNKKVNNPKSEIKPSKEDFCRVITMDSIINSKDANPFRPVALKDTNINLSKCHAASLEYAQNIYRIYNYGDDAKGVFRGEEMIVCESIPKNEERERIIGLLIYNKNDFDKELKEWNSYHNWIKNRNDARWVDQEKGLLNYDQKNMMHCFRLVFSAKNLLLNKEPIVRFDGEDRDYLMRIRNGEFEYDDLIERLEKDMNEIEDIFHKCDLPKDPNMKKINKLYTHLVKKGNETYDL